MLREARFLLRRIVLSAVVAGSAFAPAACAALLGIDDGSPISQGPDSGDAAAWDVWSEASSDGSLATEAGDQESAADSGDALDGLQDGGDGGRPAADACTSNPNWCTTHCASGPDDCNVARRCADNCPMGWSCSASTNQCECRRDPTWCNGRCGVIQDNCGIMIDCSACDAGVSCVNFTCGCNPQPNPCAARQCGQTLDSCQHPVTCGMNGLCPNGSVCDSDAGTCCAPIANPCAGRCSTSVDNGCGQSIACPAGCLTGQVCDQTTCCTPTGGCSPTCMDNCGQRVACCLDSGSGGPDGGGCGVTGSGPCSAGSDCCSGFCSANAVCVTSCSTALCTQTSECCAGLTCSPVVIGPSPDGGKGPPSMGMCQ